MDKAAFDKQLKSLFVAHNKFVLQKNTKLVSENGIYSRYKRPILTRDHAPIYWRYDMDYRSNPDLLQRLGVNTTFNAGAIELNGKY